MPQLPERINRKIIVDGECWVWIGARKRGKGGKGGYGNLYWGGRTCIAHRVVYELLIGPIPIGLQIDHLCRNRACVNPAHLEPVTSRDNIMRGNNFAAAHARKTHCPQGHEYTAENTAVSRDNERRCRRCAAAQQRNRRAGL